MTGIRSSLPTRVVGLNDAKQLCEALKDIACVVHMAGPFAATSAPMLNACLATQTNYTDITGEIEVFEAMWSRKEEIRRAGITAVPGAGDRSARWIDFGSGDEPCVPVSWGDVATAFHSAGVGNITVYFRRTKLFRSADVVAKLIGPLLQTRIGQRGLAAIVRSLPEGPSKAERIGHRATIWAEAIDSSGRCSKASLSTPDAYDFTANSVLEIFSRISSLPVALGLVTPSQAFGADFVLSLPGCSRMDIPSSSSAVTKPRSAMS
jgi:short subunit dehydrogenase-like uncharacterized protein